MAVNKLTSDIFEEKVLKNEKPVLVDFYADWCGPCKMLAPVVEQISNESDAYDVYKLNVDDAPDLAARYGVMSIPTLIVFRGGEAAARSVGVQSKAMIVKMLD
ncbi:MAG: thioredoxin [Clostridia bacterium]|nr:thioredoxin [Clostridia bacterium]